MVNGELLAQLKNKLNDKNLEEFKYKEARKKLQRKLSKIFFEELPSIDNLEVFLLKDIAVKMGFDHKDDSITLRIDTTQENREENKDNILECITYQIYGSGGSLENLNNERLQKFYDHIDIVLEQLLKKL